MWISLLSGRVLTDQKQYNHTNLTTVIKAKRILQKYKFIRKTTILSSMNKYLSFQQNVSQLCNKSNLTNIMVMGDTVCDVLCNYINFHLNIRKKGTINLISRTNKTKPIVNIFIYRSQLYTSILKNLSLKKLITNGFFLKKLDLEKNMKKNDKVTLLNLKETFNFLVSMSTVNESKIIIIKNTTTKLTKIIHFLKKKLNLNKNTVVYFSPNINYSDRKFKKIKSIKRKLTKKYSRIIKN